jgi:hypothetical protein
MSVVEQIAGFINSVPRVAIVAVAVVVVMGFFAIWKYMSSKDAEKEIPAPIVKAEPEPKPKETEPLIQAAPVAPPTTTVVNPVQVDPEPYGSDTDSEFHE